MSTLLRVPERHPLSCRVALYRGHPRAHTSPASRPAFPAGRTPPSMILLLFWVPSPEKGYSPKLVEGFSQKFAQPCKAATEIGRYSMVASSGKGWKLVPPRIP